MFKRQYHCLIAGLADLDFDIRKNILEMSEFREELRTILHPSDYLTTTILFLPHDNKNLVAFLEGKTDNWDSLGNYSLQDMEEQKRIIQSILKENNILPPYMVEIMDEWLNTENGPDKADVERKLTEGYINMALESGNGFLEKWIRFDRDLNNIFILINSKTLGFDAVKFIAGNDPLALELKEVFISGKDFRIPSEPQYVPTIFKIALENEFLEKERKSDIARWNFIDLETFFEYFTIDWILAYIIKLSIVIRWKQLDPETGQEMLKKLIQDMEVIAQEGNSGLE